MVKSRIPLEYVLLPVLGASLILISLLFNDTLADVYEKFVLITITMFFITKIDKNFQKQKKFISINSIPSNTLKSIGKALMGLTIVIIGTMIVGGMFNVLDSFTVSSVFESLQSSTPVLEGNVGLSFFAWGQLIPILETLAVGMAFVYFLSLLRVRVDDFKNPKWLALVSILSTLFMYLHLQAKGVDSLGLISTFIFMVVSLVLISIDKEYESAIWMHIINNSVVVALSLGIIGNLGF